MTNCPMPRWVLRGFPSLFLCDASPASFQEQHRSGAGQAALARHTNLNPEVLSENVSLCQAVGKKNTRAVVVQLMSA